MGASAGPMSQNLKGEVSAFDPVDFSAIEQDVFTTLSQPTENTISGTGWPTKLTFVLPDNHDRTHRLRVRLTCGALASAGSTYVRFVNNAKCFIEEATIKTTNNKVQTIKPWLLGPIWDILSQTTEQRLKVRHSQHTDLPAGVRNARATDTQYIEIPLEFWFHDTPGHQPVNLGLNNLPFIEITLKPLTEIVQYDGAAPTCNLASAELIIEAINQNSDRREDLILAAQNEGFRRAFLDLVDQPRSAAITAGTTSFSITLTNLKRPLCEIFPIFRRTANLSVAGAYNYTEINLIDQPSEVEFKFASNGKIIERVNFRDCIRTYRMLARHSCGDNAISAIPIAYTPEARNIATGFIDFNFLSNVVITFYWGTLGHAALPADVYLDLFGLAYSYVVEAKGTFIRSFD